MSFSVFLLISNSWLAESTAEYQKDIEICYSPWQNQHLSAKIDPAPPTGNFADIVYLKERSFLLRMRNVCTLKLGRNGVTVI